MIVNLNVHSCQAQIRILVNKCICRLDKVENSITDEFVKPTQSCTLYLEDTTDLLQSLRMGDAEEFNLQCFIWP